jgi:hypothetical protein
VPPGPAGNCTRLARPPAVGPPEAQWTPVQAAAGAVGAEASLPPSPGTCSRKRATPISRQ